MPTRTTQAQRTARAHLAQAAARAGREPNNPAAAKSLDDARRDYKGTAAEVYVRRLVDDAPTLTAEQRDRLAGILRTGTGAGDAA